MRRFMLVMLVLLAGCGGGEPGGPIPFHGLAGAHGPSGLDGRLSLPAGTGPFPVIIVLHGCGGIGINQRLWARRLNDWGYAALVLDSFGPRGVHTVCAPMDQIKVRPLDRAADVLSAAVWLRQQPGIDPDRIGVLGGSHGGSTAAWVTQAAYDNAFPGLLRASVDYYGPCRNASGHGSVPLLALAGEADTWGYPAATCRSFATQLRPNQVFEVHTYPGVVHAFDNPRVENMTFNEGHPLHYDAAAAEDSFRIVRRFLDHWVKDRAPRPAG